MKRIYTKKGWAHYYVAAPVQNLVEGFEVKHTVVWTQLKVRKTMVTFLINPYTGEQSFRVVRLPGFLYQEDRNR